MYKRLGSVQKKILLLLSVLPLVGLAYAPRKQAAVFREFSKEWEKVNKESLRTAIASLYKNRLIDMQEFSDGKVRLVLNDRGRKRTMEYKMEELKLKPPKQWDKKWRLIMFDIPHAQKQARDIFRSHLRRMGFAQYQKSVFIHPYPCKEEIEFLVEFYGIRPNVRQIIAEEIDNDLHFREIFKKTEYSFARLMRK